MKWQAGRGMKAKRMILVIALGQGEDEGECHDGDGRTTETGAVMMTILLGSLEMFTGTV